MAPSADMLWSEPVQLDCFLLSNIVPQNIPMNSEVWNELEQEVRRATQTYSQVWIITGAIKSTLTIGANKVAVPSFMYKIVVWSTGSGWKSMSFFIPNSDVGHSDFDAFAVSVDFIESITGLNFCNAFDPAVQAVFEDDVVDSNGF